MADVEARIQSEALDETLPGPESLRGEMQGASDVFAAFPRNRLIRAPGGTQTVTIVNRKLICAKFRSFEDPVIVAVKS
jgi:hypothetical protein